MFLWMSLNWSGFSRLSKLSRTYPLSVRINSLLATATTQRTQRLQDDSKSFYANVTLVSLTITISLLTWLIKGIYTNSSRFNSTRLCYKHATNARLITSIGLSIATILFTYELCTASDINTTVLGSIRFSHASYAVIERISL